jgi:hypothetical protein
MKFYRKLIFIFSVELLQGIPSHRLASLWEGSIGNAIHRCFRLDFTLVQGSWQSALKFLKTIVFACTNSLDEDLLVRLNISKGVLLMISKFVHTKSEKLAVLDEELLQGMFNVLVALCANRTAFAAACLQEPSLINLLMSSKDIIQARDVYSTIILLSIHLYLIDLSLYLSLSIYI